MSRAMYSVLFRGFGDLLLWLMSDPPGGAVGARNSNQKKRVIQNQNKNKQVKDVAFRKSFDSQGADHVR